MQACIPGVSQPCPVRYARVVHSDAESQSAADLELSGSVRDDEESRPRSRRGEIVMGVLLSIVGVVGTASGGLFVALASREPLDGAAVPGGFATAIVVLLAGVAAIIIGSALRHGSPWARRLVLRR